ncbi:MAG: hypothetical protein IJR69_00880 [Bacteroidaceae bacterium]|nr:hypothetical protein [Bacteroidaceae bacterium]
MNRLVFLLPIFAFSLFAMPENKKIALLQTLNGDEAVKVEGIEMNMVRGELRKAISNQSGYQAFTRTDIDQLMKEYGFQNSGMVSDAQRKKLGEMSGADYICVSTLTKSNTQFYLEAYLIDVSTGEISNPASQYGMLKDGTYANLFLLCQNLAKELISDIGSVLEEPNIIQHSSRQAPEHEYVDLALPSGTLWATCNVGATKPEEYGDYFSWGETTPKIFFDWSNYKYCNGSCTTITKYCTNSIAGTVDNKMELEPADDAATANWGTGWQMPSETQLLEIINSNNTTITWTSQNGVYGHKITSKSNGNSIFLPAAGNRALDIFFIDAGKSGCYWSRSLDSSGGGCSLFFFDSQPFVGVYNCCYGESVRPVRVQR